MKGEEAYCTLRYSLAFSFRVLQQLTRQAHALMYIILGAKAGPSP